MCRACAVAVKRRYREDVLKVKREIVKKDRERKKRRCKARNVVSGSAAMNKSQLEVVFNERSV